jgi:hypothetical protein
MESVEELMAWVEGHLPLVVASLSHPHVRYPLAHSTTHLSWRLANCRVCVCVCVCCRA